MNDLWTAQERKHGLWIAASENPGKKACEYLDKADRTVAALIEALEKEHEKDKGLGHEQIADLCEVCALLDSLK